MYVVMCVKVGWWISFSVYDPSFHPSNPSILELDFPEASIPQYPWHQSILAVCIFRNFVTFTERPSSLVR